MQIPKAAKIVEINTAVFLYKMSRQYGCAASLADVPNDVWDDIAAYGFDAVWLMGIWERSPKGRDMARSVADYRNQIRNATDDDIIGSAYSIARYEVAETFGGREGLATTRQKLAERGMGLILDYIPNHVGLDHHWVTENPGYFMPGDEDDIRERPDAFFRTEQGIIARGKDPNFPAWSDVAQLNVFSGELRDAVRGTLMAVAEQCDGVRCDMAMLLLNDIFEQTWGKRAGEKPAEEFWPSIIQPVREQYQDFTFIAEAYWNKEQTLLEQGFDYCYDKKLYDYLLKKKPQKLIDHLSKTASFQDKLIRFIANHDEPAPAGELQIEVERAAALAISTLPSARMYYDNQLVGYPEHIPVQLRRGPEHLDNEDLKTFYKSLLMMVREHGPGEDSEWSLARVKGGGHQHVFYWRWQRDEHVYCLYINYSSQSYQAHADAPSIFLTNGFDKLFGDAEARIIDKTMQISLAPWQYAIFRSR